MKYVGNLKREFQRVYFGIYPWWDPRRWLGMRRPRHWLMREADAILRDRSGRGGAYFEPPIEIRHEEGPE